MKPGRSRGRPRYDEADGFAADVFRRVGAGIVLSRDGPIPLWRQLGDQLETVIRQGDLAPHSRIPSEQALCEIFGVSRPVVRAALSALASDGLAVKLPRKGMFVGTPRPESDFITSNLSVFDDMVARGHKVTTKTFEFVKAPADAKEREALGLDEDGDVVRVGRVYSIDGEPITCTHISLPAHKLPGFEELDVEGKSIFGLIRERHGRRPHRAERWFTAAMPDPESARHMGVGTDQPMIWIESVAYEADGTALEFYRAFYNSAAARIHIAIGP